MLRFHTLKLTSRSPVAEDAVRLALAVPEELRAEYAHEPGQHVALRVALDGREERRTYSIVSAPGAAELALGVRVQAGGAVSRYLAEGLRVGDTLEVMTPNGSFHPAGEAGATPGRRYAAFAAGSGISPVLGIISTVLEREPGSRCQLFYGNTGIGRTMFAEEIMGLKDRYLARFSVHFVMSREPQELAVFNGRLDAAKIRELAQGAFDPATVDEYFLCGPGTMIDDLHAELTRLGARGRIHVEHFTPVGDASAAQPVAADAAPPPRAGAIPAPVAAPAVAADRLATVTVVMDGRRRTFDVTAADEFVLDAAGRAGLDLPFSCRAGVCSTCRARLVRGTVALDNNVALEDWELDAGYILCCQARPTSPELEISYDE
jgi:ring-1,2-phenylacetyl-CoA epoxidase subunit PaaE